MSTPVYTIIRGRAPANRHETGRIMDVTYHDVVVAPHSPLRLGQVVHVYNLEPNPNRPAPHHHEPRQYIASRTDVRGRIVGIRAMEKNLLELVVKNTLPRSATMYAYLTVSYLEGITISLKRWTWLATWIARKLLQETRRVPVDRGAIILHSRGDGIRMRDDSDDDNDE
ncbi:hypothetical protein GY45DRAFT_1402416 [Cubamyces sp. BRFM 1775]|nr:hypothetical protein GY45DRAFT_1402416 [Cubamyces sp. BRFM 1775]